MAPIEVVDALQSAAVAINRAHGSSEDVDTVSALPLIIKNTFFDVEEEETEQAGPKSLSCPAEMLFPSFPSTFPVSSGSLSDAFAGSSLSDALAGSSELNLSDLAAAARMFSSSNVTREFMECTGHVGARAMPPPPLCEPELPDVDEPQAPVWTPTVGTPQHKRPSPPPLSYPETPVSNMPQVPFQVPFWTPKEGGPAPPPAPSPIMPPLSPPLPGGFAYTLQSQRATAMYRVSHGAGIDVRKGPSFDAPKAGVTLYCNEIFAVSEEIPASDGRIYLLLADGRGWAFNDSALNPHCPSVSRGQWVPVAPAAMTPSVSPTSTVWEPMEEPMTDMTKKRRRRKRGGVRRNKNKNKNMATFLSGSSADAETEVPSSDDVEGEDDEEDTPSEKAECRSESLKTQKV